MLTEKYNLNQATLDFMKELTKTIETSKVMTNKELIEMFNQSRFYNPVVENYYATSRQKSIWFAIHRLSDYWKKLGRGQYQRI